MEVLNPKEDIPITPYLAGREVLDVACGPDIYHYDARPASLHVGIDVSVPFLLQAAATWPDSFFVCGYAHRLPFADNAFEVVLLLQVMHHLPQPHRQILAEACRVARERVIVYDHLQSARGPKRWLKTAWWRLADRGVRYNTEEEWRKVLAGFEVEERRITGKHLDNIIEFVIAGPGRGDPSPSATG
jgi:ubiquinone/menaquinone biosynthesis C-methylase UbiE